MPPRYRQVVDHTQRMRGVILALRGPAIFATRRACYDTARRSGDSFVPLAGFQVYLFGDVDKFLIERNVTTVKYL